MADKDKVIPNVYQMQENYGTVIHIDAISPTQSQSKQGGYQLGERVCLQGEHKQEPTFSLLC